MYYIAKVKFESIDDNTGRIRKIYEQYLVDAGSISEAEELLNKRFEESIAEFSVVSIQESKIMGVVK
jgi:hypothetical protein